MLHYDSRFMKIACEQALEGLVLGEGGPFGAVIVKDGQIVGVGHNQVVKNNDPTCHGEIQAIRNACHRLSTFDLSHCELYTTFEPCAMCLAACMWAHIDTVYFGCTTNDAEEIGFADNTVDDNLQVDRLKLYTSGYLIGRDRDICMPVLDKYKDYLIANFNKANHTLY